MNLDFYDLAQTEILHSVDILSIKEDDEKITGMTYFKREARTCRLEFFEDTWTSEYLRDIKYSECIGKTDILKKVVKFTLNGHECVYYLQKKEIVYDKKEKSFSVRAIDLLGVLLLVGSDKEMFYCEIEDALALTETTVNDILDINTDIQFNINSNAVSQSTYIENFIISHAEKDYFDGEPIYYLGYYGIYEATIRFRYIGQPDGYDHPIVIMVDWTTTDYDQVEEDLGLEMKYFYGEITEEVILEKIMSGDYSGYISKESADDRWNTLLGNFEAFGFPETSNLNFSDSNGDYVIDNSRLKFTGTFFFDNIKLKPDDENSGWTTRVQNDVLSGLLFLNNLYIYASGNTLYIGNKTGFIGTAITIDDADVLEYAENGVNFRFDDVDFSGILGVFLLGESISRAVEYYYRALQGNFDVEVTGEILNSYDISMTSIVNIYGRDFAIIKLGLDNDGFSYKLKAWSV